jgi:2-polyprenyl-6-methoxyphenol hydroxylase-like FAD-dependent oxidoreductase
MTLLNKKIGVIGGGIGGLASAIAFAKFGSQVTLYEKALVISEVGAGIQISANGINVLTKLGIYPDYLK